MFFLEIIPFLLSRPVRRRKRDSDNIMIRNNVRFNNIESNSIFIYQIKTRLFSISLPIISDKSEFSKIKQSSVIKSLAAEKCKSFEFY